MVLDTDHCVAILRGQLDVDRHVAPSASLFVSAVSVAELCYGALRSVRSEANLRHVEELLAGLTVLPVDGAVARRFARLKHALATAGTPVADADLQIAAIALEHRMPLVTHNRRHFDRIDDVELADWLAE